MKKSNILDIVIKMNWDPVLLLFSKDARKTTELNLHLCSVCEKEKLNGVILRADL